MELLFLNIGTQEFILLVPVLLTVILYIYCLIHCIANNRLRGNSKLLWLIIILVAPFLGSVIYLIVGRKGNKGDYGTTM
ncbi:MAG TPA: PLD nuclease N-terminal domain-containing protein [Parapedobacter sp.]|uniref:PLD nuclease N-terminal domain-containing protein n=1 Tax=Parapedobacter sp. TaxID=1958893 RepID=UPI002BA83A2C|nr:PLD nuclease N-terminal domain-containing protein [Parapedobacter sp.]HWK57241.1 PLD nuclease N-terminal domain-containing protein [Parapedobacter sp.]